jgi:hypothetical protein
MSHACRLVIDTGIRPFCWTRERAMGYLRDRAALSEHGERGQDLNARNLGAIALVSSWAGLVLTVDTTTL